MKTKDTTAIVASTRLYTLDYLRGFAACGIMLFHYLNNGVGSTTGANTFLMRIGSYGVSIFYVLSGLTLYYVYFRRMKPSLPDLKDFYVKRFFRIFPLLWLVVILTLLIKHYNPGWKQLVLNFTGLFSFIHRPGLALGQWSIGNELVFYLFFPFFVLFSKKSKFVFYLFSAAIIAIYLYFAFRVLTPNIDLVHQWTTYINPLNQVFLFLGGYLIGFLFREVKISKTTDLLILAVGLLLLIFYPTGNGNEAVLVTGINRLVFTGICFIICFAFYKNTVKLPRILNRFFTFLGEASYSVYLLHPIVWGLVGLIALPAAAHIIISIPLTFFVSYIVYNKYERYFMEKGRVIAKKYINPPKETTVQQTKEATAV
ncbi:MAG TPA: acyltransferase [Flavipsychrobacter sp.]|nr:acyltransferase [Flavipsychrobacter sp.]